MLLQLLGAGPTNTTQLLEIVLCAITVQNYFTEYTVLTLHDRYLTHSSAYICCIVYARGSPLLKETWEANLSDFIECAPTLWSPFPSGEGHNSFFGSGFPCPHSRALLFYRRSNPACLDLEPKPTLPGSASRCWENIGQSVETELAAPVGLESPNFISQLTFPGRPPIPKLTMTLELVVK